ncbi:hypothetical protein FHX62_002730 [Cupriavidus alkaliphilus]|nr:hypothetical protein [Cupriavidus alkaliphilus]
MEIDLGGKFAVVTGGASGNNMPPGAALVPAGDMGLAFQAGGGHELADRASLGRLRT